MHGSKQLFILLCSIPAAWGLCKAQNPVQFSKHRIEIDSFRISYDLDRKDEPKLTGHASYFFSNISDSPVVLESLKWSNSRNYMHCKDRYDPILPGKRIACTALTKMGHPRTRHRSHTSVTFNFYGGHRERLSVRSELPQLPLELTFIEDSLDSELSISVQIIATDTITLQSNGSIELLPGQSTRLLLTADQRDRFRHRYAVFTCRFDEKTIEYRFTMDD